MTMPVSEQLAEVVELLPSLRMPCCGNVVANSRPRRKEQKELAIVAHTCPVCKTEVLLQAQPHGLTWKVI